MSDMGLYEDPYDQELLNQYAMIDGQLPGAKPKDRLSFLNSMSNMLGFNPVALAGVQNPEQDIPQWTETPNETGMTYGSNPLYASIFQAIDNGADPISAAKAAKDSGQFGTMTDADFNRNIEIATKYAGENAAQVSAKTKFEAENADKIGGYTAPDGSKYKQSPMGGNDINGWASEYDLLGTPSEQDLVAQYAQRDPKLRQASDKMKIDSTKGRMALPPGQRADGFGWGPSTHAQMSDNTSAVGTGGVRAVMGDIPGYNTGRGDSILPASAATNDPNYDPKGLFSTDKGVDKMARYQAEKVAKGQITKAKGTMVRSDANTNAMRRVAALLTMIQGSAS